MMYSRFLRLCKAIGRLLAVGLLYAALCILWGRPLIPCPFYTLTGWYCPACGVSRLCLALLRLDLPAAFAANPLLLTLLPVGAVMAIQMGVRYVRTGMQTPTRTQNIVLIVLIVVLVLFGIARNLPGFAFLQPQIK